MWDVIELANRHPRVNILKPGPGVGGHCIAVDPWFIVDAAPEQTPLIRTAREVNDGKVDHVVGRVVAMLDASPNARASLLGLAFKADIDDLRESPAVKVAADLISRYGDRVDLVEPFVTALPRSLDGGRLVSLDEGLANEILVVLVDHSAFKTVPAEARAGRQLYDTRGMWR